MDIQGTWLSWHLDRSLASGELRVQRAAWTEKREAARGPSHACSAHRRRWGGAVTEARTARGTEGLEGMASWPEFPKPASCLPGRDRNSTLAGLLQGSSGDKGGSEWYKTGREHTDHISKACRAGPRTLKGVGGAGDGGQWAGLGTGSKLDMEEKEVPRGSRAVRQGQLGGEGSHPSRGQAGDGERRATSGRPSVGDCRTGSRRQTHEAGGREERGWTESFQGRGQGSEQRQSRTAPACTKGHLPPDGCRVDHFQPPRPSPQWAGPLTKNKGPSQQAQSG